MRGLPRSSLAFTRAIGGSCLDSGWLGVKPSVSAAGPDGKTVANTVLRRDAASTPSDALAGDHTVGARAAGRPTSCRTGHRVVHGGMNHSGPARVTSTCSTNWRRWCRSRRCTSHTICANPKAMRLNPELPQVACFDTAFHRSAPSVEQAFALPRALFDEAFALRLHVFLRIYCFSIARVRAGDR